MDSQPTKAVEDDSMTGLIQRGTLWTAVDSQPTKPVEDDSMRGLIQRGTL